MSRAPQRSIALTIAEGAAGGGEGQRGRGDGKKAFLGALRKWLGVGHGRGGADRAMNREAARGSWPNAQVLSITSLPAFAFSRAARPPLAVRRAIASTGGRLDATGPDLYRRLLTDSGRLDATLCMRARWNLAEVLPDLARLRAPMLFLVGGRNRAAPPEVSFRVARRARGARVEVMPGLGHLPQEETPGARRRRSGRRVEGG
jgi:pimeloyl-ACP methyl ester carboxylesterase